MSSLTRYNYCPCCLYRALELRLDKKQRGYFRCQNCGSTLFVRLGWSGIANTANALSLLANPDAWRYVKSEGAGDAERLMRGAVRDILADDAVGGVPYTTPLEEAAEKKAVNE